MIEFEGVCAISALRLSTIPNERVLRDLMKGISDFERIKEGEE